MNEREPRARTYKSAEGGAITIGELLCLEDKGVSEIRGTNQRGVYALIYSNESTPVRLGSEILYSSSKGNDLEQSVFDPQVPDYHIGYNINDDI